MRNTALDGGMSEEGDSFVTETDKPEGSKSMEQKIYKTMKAAGAANIAIGVLTIVVGLASGILLIVAGGRLIVEKSRILF